MPELAPRGVHRYTFTSGSRPLDGYTIKRAIGRGGFGEVYYATSDAGKEVALKLLTRNIEIERRGVQHCMNLKSPNLITIYDLKTNEDGDTFVIMEYVSGPSLACILADHSNGLPAHEVRRWLKGLVDGVSYLHDHGIVHRDLKPANLFLEEGVVKIGDYGLSKSITHSQDAGMSENVGTCYYMAPEISSGKYHKPIDVYAIGVILHEMLTGRVPFEGESTAEVLMKHLTSMPDVSRLEEPYRAIVRRALAKDPNHRPPRVVDLLLPEDAPRPPDIRIIGKDGDGLTATSPPVAGKPAEAAPREDVFYIGPEEPILFIGPDTRPEPRSRARKAAPRRFWGAAPTPVRTAPARPARVRSERRGWFGRSRKTQPQPLPPEPPPLPGSRIRVAELASSMLWSAPLAGVGSILCFPAYEALGVDLPQDPIQLAFLFMMVLLGTWLVLGAGKFCEGKTVASGPQRFGYLVLGLVLGFLGLGLGTWTHLNPAPPVHAAGFDAELVAWSSSLGPPEFVGALGFASYFGLTYGLTSWWNMTSRGRPGRFRFWPVIKAGVVGGLVGLVWPAPQPWSLIVVVLVAVLVQLVSPWSRETASYEAALRRAPRAA